MTCTPLQAAEIPYTVFSMAEAFSASVNAIMQASNESANVAKGVDREHLLTVPTIVNESFAVELYFKCLHSIDDVSRNAPRGHDLHKLYTGLGTTRQSSVRSRFEKVRASNRVTAARASRMSRPALPTIEETLKESSRAFEQFRYVWEGENRIRGFDLMNVRAALRSEIIAARPDFKPLVELMAMTAIAVTPCGPDCRGILSRHS